MLSNAEKNGPRAPGKIFNAGNVVSGSDDCKQSLNVKLSHLKY